MVAQSFQQFNEKLKERGVASAKVAETRDELGARMFLGCVDSQVVWRKKKKKKIKTYLLCTSQDVFPSKQTQGYVHIFVQKIPGKEI